MTATVRIIRNGSTQAVELPREFGFDADEVCVKRLGSAVLLFPKGAAWDVFAETLGKADEDYLPQREQSPRPDSREPL